MLFHKSQSPRSQQLTTGDWSALAELFGVPATSIMVDGNASFKEITVYTCIKILSESVAKLPLKIYRDTGNGSEKVTNDYRYNLLKLRPNPYMSAYDFWRLMEIWVDTQGNAYAYIDAATSGRNAGKIAGLYPLKPDQMTVYVDDSGLISSQNRVWYVYRDDMGKEYPLNSDSVLHFKGMSLNGLIGMSVLETLRMTIENAKGASSYLNTSYKNGMQAAGFLQYTGDLGDESSNALRAKFEKMTSGILNSNRIAVMPPGIAYQPFSLKMTDAQFLENTQLTIQQLTAAFGIKPHQVNDQTKTSYASTMEANREFYSDTLLGKLTMYEQENNFKLFTDPEVSEGYYTKFNADVILRGDAEKRYNTYAKAVQNMILTPKECRDMEDLPARDGADELYGNAALVPATMLSQGLPYLKKLKNDKANNA